MIEFLKSFLFGIVEGITEWLPISSTGHMILVDEFIKLNVPKDFMEMFLVVIQLGAILAVCVIYFHKLNPFSPKKSAKEKRETVDIWGKVIVGCLPAAVIGLAFNDKIDALFYNAPTVAFTLIRIFFMMMRFPEQERFLRQRHLLMLQQRLLLFYSFCVSFYCLATAGMIKRYDRN